MILAAIAGQTKKKHLKNYTKCFFIFQCGCKKCRSLRHKGTYTIRRLSVIKSTFFWDRHLHISLNSQMAEIFIAGGKTELLTLVDWNGMNCSGCAGQRVNSVSCCTVAHWRWISKWFWGFFGFLFTLSPWSLHVCTREQQLIWWVLSKNCN